MKKVLGLDLGTNSIGWALLTEDDNNSKIEKAGSRIIPMDAAMLGDFDKGNSISQTATRTQLRGVRRLRQRHLLRRERLHRVLDVVGFLPEHYSRDIIFRAEEHPDKHYGQFRENKEPKLAWYQNDQGQFEFLFKDSFEEMLAEFKAKHPDMFTIKLDGSTTLIPYDWTIYYLRKKALSQKISEAELAWILLNFNQKRGYYQLRGEDDDQQEGKLKEYYVLKVVDVQATDQKKGKDIWYNVTLENGLIYRRSSSRPLDEWLGRTMEFIVTTDIEKDGTLKLNKDGEVKRSLSLPSADDWTLVKKRTENNISKSGKEVGEYIYDALLDDPRQKIIGKLVRVVERKFYKDELKRILDVQSKLHKQFASKELLKRCVEELYPNNAQHRNILLNKDLVHLLINDIIFYQRPLKSKKHLIADCQYEQHSYIDKETSLTRTVPLKAIHKSNPIFQEFRLWQFVSNLRIYRKGGSEDADVTSEFITDIVEIFDWLNTKKEIDQSGFLSRKEFGIKKNETSKYRWNYVEDKKYPCNETQALINTRLAKNGISVQVDTMRLWHILYSVSDPKELESALRRFAAKSGVDKEKFVEAFKRCKPFENAYGSYSEKATKKLLSLMRQGKYWDENAIDASTKDRIDKILNGEFDENIDEPTRLRCRSLSDITHFQGLPLHLACYIVYGRHSESKDNQKWNSPDDIDQYLRHFKQHSLKNPIVEQVVTETLRVVRDVWRQSGQIDRIHIELGREMKNSAPERKRLTENINENENTNHRIKMLLCEFADPYYGIEDVRPHSPSQQDILRIYEDTALKSVAQIPDDIETTIKKFRESDTKKQPSKPDISRYKLWLEQRYRSPYTGEIIPLGKLFTAAYQIEHVIPKSRFFDDSFTNKVICEAEVNKLKDKSLGLEFIESHHGEKVTLCGGKTVTVFEVEDYKKFVSDHYSNNRAKMKKLLLNETPDSFTSRQMNDSRYISKLIKSILSNIVMEQEESEATSKNVIVCSGGVTDRLKREWGLNDIWNDVVSSRFERLNGLTNSDNFGAWVNVEGKKYFQANMPLELSKGFNKKRIDHRHHAMDAIVIACATRDHVNYLNNQSAGGAKEDLKHKLCFKNKVDADGSYIWSFKKPWDSFTQDASQAINDIVVGFKQNLRVINKTKNRTLFFNPEKDKKDYQTQCKGDSWAVRKSMHKDTVSGRVNLRDVKEVRLKEAIENWEAIVDKSLKREIQSYLTAGKDPKAISKILKEREISKVSVYYFSDDKAATRKSIDTTFDAKKISSITDSGIRKILLAHLDRCEGDTEEAFSPEGLVRMNENIVELNNGNPHKPIYKARVCDALGKKFPVGFTGNKSGKYVVAAEGTNLFFGVYQNNDGKRNYASIPLNEVIERQKQGLSSVPELNEKGEKWLFTLSPNDLVYLPTPDQIGEDISIEDIDKSRIYKMVSSSGNESQFIPHTIAKSIVDKYEFSSHNKMGRAISGEMIKEICLKIEVDRLGNIVKI